LERASQARYLTSLVIATDDERIRRPPRIFGESRDHSPDHLSGTDRVAEAASASNAQIVVNIQGDEPMIDPAAIDAAVLGILDREEAPMSTLKTASSEPPTQPIRTSSKWSRTPTGTLCTFRAPPFLTSARRTVPSTAT